MSNKQQELIDTFRYMTNESLKPSKSISSSAVNHTGINSYRMFGDYLDYIDKIENPNNLTNTMLRKGIPVSIHALLCHGTDYLFYKDPSCT